MPRLLLAFLPGLWALREDLEAISLASKVPRNCDVGGKSSTCCACGKVIRKSWRQNEWMESVWGKEYEMCQRTTDPSQERICCPLWAKDCEEEDPYYQHRLELDCLPEDEQCLKSTECKNVQAEWSKVRRMLKQLRKPKASLKQAKITGESNHGWRMFCDCACGDLVNKEKLECKWNGEKALACPVTRPCCTRLEDCKPEDPWHMWVTSEDRDIQERTKEYEASLQTLESLERALRRLRKVCVTNCRVVRASQCRDFLLSAKEKKLFQKDKSWLKVIEEERFEKKLGTQKSLTLVQQLENVRAAAEKQALVLLPELQLTGGAPGMTCCACEQPQSDLKPLLTMYPKVTGFCTLPRRDVCEDYVDEDGGAACKRTATQFCSAKSPACPEDQGAFSKPGDWKETFG